MGWQERVDRRNDELGRTEQDRLVRLESSKRSNETRSLEKRGRALEALNGLGVRDILRDIQEEWGEGDITQDTFNLSTEVFRSYLLGFEVEDIGSATGLFLSTKVPTLDFKYEYTTIHYPGGPVGQPSDSGSWSPGWDDIKSKLVGAKLTESKVLIGVSFWPGTDKNYRNQKQEHNSSNIIYMSGSGQGWSVDIDLSKPVIMIHSASPLFIDGDEDKALESESSIAYAFEGDARRYRKGHSNYHPYSMASLTASNFENTMVDFVENMKKHRKYPGQVRKFVAESSKRVQILS